jgi:hypothetical protein
MATRISLVQPVSGAQAIGSTDRVGRYPKHTFNTVSMPFSVTPIGIAPVIAGETLTNLFMESRVITDPINNPITGWKKEYFFFFVKATTIYGDAIRNMFVDFEGAPTDLSVTNGAAANSLAYYTAKGGVPYLELGLKKIVDTYFRDEGEAWNTPALINGYPAAQIRENSWMDSLLDKDLVPEGAQLDTAADTGDLQRLISAYETLRTMGLANITWEEYLGTFGINFDTPAELDRPELLMHTSDFQYPSNTINPADGSPSSAVSWVFRQGENKKRKFFREPGFVIGLTVTRPKVFYTGLAGNMAAHMSRAWDWMPELLLGIGGSTLKAFDAGTGPLGDRTTDTDKYFADMKDLLLHGDQFQNRAAFNVVPAVASAINGVPLPDVALNWRYPLEAHVQSFFKSAGFDKIREDGYFSLTIRGKQRETSPGSALTV